jgi:hypothetical protein
MANADRSRGVERENQASGYILRGKKDALIASGQAQPAWFPCGTERNKRGVVRTRRLKHEGLNVRVTHRPATDDYVISVDTSAVIAPALPDPGYDSVRSAHPETAAQFKVGDVVMYWSPSRERHGERLEITKAFDLVRVGDDEGRFIGANGNRIDYCWGYLAKRLGEKALFYSAGQLRDAGGSIRHLKIVSGT